MSVTNILITGGNGLIGNNLMSELALNDSLHVFGAGRSENSTVILDLSLDWDVKVLPKNIDIVIHLAQSEKFRDFPQSAEEIFSVNTISTLKLLEYARKAGAKKFIYASSGGIYGTGNDEFTEDIPVSMQNDLGFYLSTKFCSELLVQSYATFFDIDILRFFFVYGKEQRADMLIPRLVDSVKNGRPVILQGEEGIRINPIHVSDAVNAIVACLQLRGNNRINIAGNEVLSLKEICNKIGTAIGVEPKFNIRDQEPRHLVADITRMKELLIAPQRWFADAISEMI